MEINPDELNLLLIAKIDKSGPIQRSNLFYRNLTSYDWYTIINLIPHEDLDSLLDDDILDSIHSKDLKEKYLYTRSVISK